MHILKLKDKIPSERLSNHSTHHQAAPKWPKALLDLVDSGLKSQYCVGQL